MSGAVRGAFALVEGDGPVFIRCEALAAIRGVRHGFSTRRAAGEETTFDLGPADAATPEHARRAARLLEACGLGGRRPAAPRQVHGAEVLNLAVLEPGVLRPGDAVYAGLDDAGRGAPAVRTADCLPLLLAERGGRAVAAVHAGWRGTAAGIATRVLETLAGEGIDPRELIVALGPAIGPCCYAVGPEVLEAVARASGVPPERLQGRRTADAAPTLDLAEANRRQLVAGGVPDGAVHRAAWCTHCEAGLFWSYRRDGARAGRMLAAIGWEAGDAPAVPGVP